MKLILPRKTFGTGILLGGILGVSLFYFLSKNIPNHPSTQLRLGLEGYVNPLVACNSGDQNIGTYKKLNDQLEDQIEQMVSKGTIKRASLYFRDLNSAEWFGVNEEDSYVAASLAKVPVMIAYYKIAEYNPEILKQKLLFNKDIDANQTETYKAPTSLQKGTYYSVEDLIERMIIYSGNNSFQLLLTNLNKDILVKIYLDLDLSIFTEEIKNFTSPRSFSTLWRALYNASYLDKEYSNKALELLSKSEFKPGLVARLPHNTTVAHKFGERTEINPDGSMAFRQLHDCGIIYYPDHPYLLCAMTEGKEFSQLEQALQTISYTAYQYVDKKYK